MTRPAIVQTTFDFAMREINALEGRIVRAEDDADAMLWTQAEQVVAQLKGGMTQRQVAAQWINARTSDPYSHVHVGYVAQVVGKHAYQDPRPRFRDAYNEIAHASTAHVSHNSGNNEWYTPAEYIAAARAVLGGIDLDPASTAEANKVVQATTIYTLAENGLTQPWRGRVWLNPPYSQPVIEHFATKLAYCVTAGDVTAAITLVNNGTETEWFRTFADVAQAICFPEGRIRFWSTDRESATPLQGQALLYSGTQPEAFSKAFRSFGVVLVKPE